MQAIICQAIKERKVLQFSYEGNIRIVEPFTLGNHKDTGNLVLSAFRIGGYSKSANEPQWRLYIVNEMQNLSSTNQRAMATRPGYNPNDSRMSTIICTA